MAKVKIMFSGDIGQIGKVRTVPDGEAAAMVREGRARYVAEPPPVAEPPRAAAPGKAEASDKPAPAAKP